MGGFVGGEFVGMHGLRFGEVGGAEFGVGVGGGGVRSVREEETEERLSRLLDGDGMGDSRAHVVLVLVRVLVSGRRADGVG